MVAYAGCIVNIQTSFKKDILKGFLDCDTSISHKPLAWKVLEVLYTQIFKSQEMSAKVNTFSVMGKERNFQS